MSSTRSFHLIIGFSVSPKKETLGSLSIPPVYRELLLSHSQGARDT